MVFGALAGGLGLRQQTPNYQKIDNSRPKQPTPQQIQQSSKHEHHDHRNCKN